MGTQTNNMRVLVLLTVICAYAQASSSPASSTCLDLKEVYKGNSCCGNDAVTEVGAQVVPKPAHQINYGNNPCDGKKPTDAYCNNQNCTTDGSSLTGGRDPNIFEQAGANVTAGYQGDIEASNRQPITTSFLEAGLCPVNVHFHLGSEHYSKGFQCKLYDAADAKFTTE